MKKIVTLYHTSDREVRIPSMSHVSEAKTFGFGFYLYDNVTDAKNYANYRKENRKDASIFAQKFIINEYKFDLSDLDGLTLPFSFACVPVGSVILMLAYLSGRTAEAEHISKIYYDTLCKDGTNPYGWDYLRVLNLYPEAKNDIVKDCKWKDYTDEDFVRMARGFTESPHAEEFKGKTSLNTCVVLKSEKAFHSLSFVKSYPYYGTFRVKERG